MVTQIFIFANRAPTGEPTGLLGSDARLEIVGWETEAEEALQRLQDIRPDVVIVAFEGAASKCAPVLARIAQASPGVQLLEINLETSVVQIHGGETAVVQDVRELMSAIQWRACRAGRMKRLDPRE